MDKAVFQLPFALLLCKVALLILIYERSICITSYYDSSTHFLIVCSKGWHGWEICLGSAQVLQLVGVSLLDNMWSLVSRS